MATQNEDMNARRIVGSVTQGGRAYVAGQESELAGVLTQQSLDRLVEKGALVGDWSTSSRVEGGEASSAAPATQPPSTSRRRSAQKSTAKTDTAKKTATKSARKSTKKRGS